MTRNSMLCWMAAALAGTASLMGTDLGSVAPHRAIDRSPAIESLENWRLVSLTRTYFATGKAELSATDESWLHEVAKRYGRSNRVVIELRGYTDGAESAEGDLALSTERAEAIARFLITNGVTRKSIRVLGLGEIMGSGGAANREHRRVDVRVFIQRADAS